MHATKDEILQGSGLRGSIGNFEGLLEFPFARGLREWAGEEVFPEVYDTEDYLCALYCF